MTRYELFIAAGEPGGIYSVWLGEKMHEFFEVLNGHASHERLVYEKGVAVVTSQERIRWMLHEHRDEFDAWLAREVSADEAISFLTSDDLNPCGNDPYADEGDRAEDEGHPDARVLETEKGVE